MRTHTTFRGPCHVATACPSFYCLVHRTLPRLRTVAAARHRHYAGISFGWTVADADGRRDGTWRLARSAPRILPAFTQDRRVWTGGVSRLRNSTPATISPCQRRTFWRANLTLLPTTFCTDIACTFHHIRGTRNTACIFKRSCARVSKPGRTLYHTAPAPLLPIQCVWCRARG